MNLFFIAFCVAGMICFICYFLFVREDIKGRLKRPSTWKNITTYQKVLFLGIIQFAILLVGMLFSVPFVVFFAK